MQRQATNAAFGLKLLQSFELLVHDTHPAPPKSDRYEIHINSRSSGAQRFPHITLRGERLNTTETRIGDQLETVMLHHFLLLYSSIFCIILPHVFNMNTDDLPRSSWTAPMAGSPMGSAQLTMVFGDGHS